MPRSSPVVAERAVTCIVYDANDFARPTRYTVVDVVTIFEYATSELAGAS